MPPTLKRSSTRYLPASVSPTSGSPVVSRAVPSVGQSVLVSEYSVPQRGHFFIITWCLLFLLAQPGDGASVSHRLRDRQSVLAGPAVSWRALAGKQFALH